MSTIVKNISFPDQGRVIFGGPMYSNPAASSGLGGSILFDGTDQNLTIPASSDWAIGTGDFTIEWFQYMAGTAGAQRPFTIGGYPSASIAVSIETDASDLYVWINGQAVASNGVSGLAGAWAHIAVVRSSGTINVYQNGVSIASGSSTDDITDSSDVLSIGAEYQTPAANVTFFDGNITNFRWTNGTAIYTSNFTTPTAPLSAVTGTKLLLLASTSGSFLDDSSTNHYTVTNVGGATWSNQNPF